MILDRNSPTSFDKPVEPRPFRKFTRARLNKLAVLMFIGLAVMASLSVNAQPVSVLHSFTNSPDGAYPYLGGGCVLLSNTLYGTTDVGGLWGKGTLFSVATDGTGFSVLYNFTGGSDGSSPASGLVLFSNVLYGTTLHGGTNNSGVVFAVSTNGGNFTVLHTFTTTIPSIGTVQPSTIVTNADGACPYGELLLSDNTLYGTTSLGGTNGAGTVFSVKSDGSDFTVIHSFSPRNTFTNADGFYSTAGLVSLGDTLYGTTSAGGTNKNGVVFALSTNGDNFAILHTFDVPQLSPPTNTDGAWPSGLALSGDVLYGTTANQGPKLNGTIFALHTDGSAFKVLHSFVFTEGSSSLAQLSVLGNRLYGTASQGGLNGSGSVFSVNTDGSDFSVLYNFTAKGNSGTNMDGAYTTSSLVLSGNMLYATPQQGGSQSYGTVIGLELPFGFSAIDVNPDGSATLSLSGTPNLTYIIQATTNLSPPVSWQTIATNKAGANGSWQFTDSNANNYPSQFYRSAIP